MAYFYLVCSRNPIALYAFQFMHSVKPLAGTSWVVGSKLSVEIPLQSECFIAMRSQCLEICSAIIQIHRCSIIDPSHTLRFAVFPWVPLVGFQHANLSNKMYLHYYVRTTTTRTTYTTSYVGHILWAQLMFYIPMSVPLSKMSALPVPSNNLTMQL